MDMKLERYSKSEIRSDWIRLKVVKCKIYVFGEDSRVI